jgi:bacteriocin-like protein
MGAAAMTPSRKLTLRKESLAELTTDELQQVAGGAPWTPACPLTIELTEKLSIVLSCNTC